MTGTYRSACVHVHVDTYEYIIYQVCYNAVVGVGGYGLRAKRGVPGRVNLYVEQY